MRWNSLILLCVFPLLGQAASQPSTLDTAKVHALYVDGDFNEAISMLEKTRRAGELTSHADSVFTYKHLGVMYSAKYETMEKGKQFMYQLLKIEPTVSIMDMYASDMIYMIFRNVQTEFEIRRARPGAPAQENVAAIANSDKVSRKRTNERISKTRTWPYWTAGAVLVVGAGVSAYFILSEPPSEPKRFEGGL